MDGKNLLRGMLPQFQILARSMDGHWLPPP
jgi:hypothetical protein